MAAAQQHRENHPGDQRQHGFVHQVLGEQVVHVHKAEQNRQRQQALAQPDGVEQHRLHHLHGREQAHHPADVAVLELAVLDHQQQGLACGQHQHRVSQYRQQHMQADAVFQRVSVVTGVDPQAGGDDQCRERKHQRADPLERPVQAGHQHQPGAHRRHAGGHREQAQAQPLVGDQQEIQPHGVGGHRQTAGQHQHRP